MGITWLEFILFSLAVFRLTRLLVYDLITEWIRAPFMNEYEEADEKGRTAVYTAPKEGGLRGWIGALLSCYWCTGIWVSMGLLAVRFYLPPIYNAVVIVFAVAGLAAIFETWIQTKKLE